MDERPWKDYINLFVEKGNSIVEDPNILMRIVTIGNLVYNSWQESHEIGEADLRDFTDLCSEILYQGIFMCFLETPRRIGGTCWHEQGFYSICELIKICLAGSEKLKDFTIPAKI